MSSARSRSSTDPVSHALGGAVDSVLAAVAALDVANPVVLIDGRSGSGKSTLARLVASHWPRPTGTQTIALDSLYPGWDGLSLGAEYAREQILLPHARGTTGVWREWDWEADVRTASHTVDPALPLIVEGAGTLTRSAAPLADIRVWLESPAAARKERALERDGDTYRPHWDRWAAQEEHHIETNSPVDRATHVFRVP